MRWWNVNGRWRLANKDFLECTDVLFISECHCSIQIMPEIDGFKIVGEEDVPLVSKHGGNVVYIRNDLYEHLLTLRFSKVSISFNFTFAPNVVFMGIYIYPIDSVNYNDGDFALLSKEIEFWLERGFTPFIAGDFNSRIGDISSFSRNCLRWRYRKNIDSILNQHGKALLNICDIHQIQPINDCKYYNTQFDGSYTYCKGDKRSQIDFVLTNCKGRQLISEFKIVQTGWHTSDHLPLQLKVNVRLYMNASMLWKRSCELKPYLPSQQPLIRSHRFKFDEEKVLNELTRCSDLLENVCRDTSDPDVIIDEIESVLIPIVRAGKLKRQQSTQISMLNVIAIAHRKCDAKFQKYKDCVFGKVSKEDLIVAQSEYQDSRKQLNQIISKEHENEYACILESKDDSILWKRINWSGKLNHKNSKHPDISELAEHFEMLYQPMAEDDTEKLDDLKSDIYIPVNDDAIVIEELEYAHRSMKKGGWDFSLPVLNALMKSVPVVLLMLMNILFFSYYPLKLSLSILHAIPKTGNLLLCMNYRGIQMQQILALLYDRIIAARLVSWAKISYEQSAFQKGKSTLNHIFTLRVLIGLCKKYGKPLYIGCFDLSKAFDKVSRLELLRSLIRLGIGSCLLEAIKATYKVTRCALKGFGKISDVFRTYSGIKQGAPSSVILFIVFMDDIVEVLKQKCTDEFIIANLHSLLHADDTLVFSLSRELFKKKCNVLIDTFHKKKLTLNLKKSAYMIVNTKENDFKTDLKLNSGWLPYKSSVKYLGAIFSDSGDIHGDIKAHAESKDKAVSVKFLNFLLDNTQAPITVKFKVLTSCVKSALLYGCEGWGNGDLSKVEVVHKKAIRYTLGVKRNTANDVLYVESGLEPLKATVRKQQYKFWQKILDEIQDSPDSPIVSIYKTAIEKKIPFIKHYIELHNKFCDENECYKHFLNVEQSNRKRRLLAAHEVDPNGVKGTYVSVNPPLESPQYYSKYYLNETDRLLLTKYRTGSHDLNIQKGRYSNVDRDQRLCVCKDDVQNIHHVIFYCKLTEATRDFALGDISVFFKDIINAPRYLRIMERVLDLKR